MKKDNSFVDKLRSFIDKNIVLLLAVFAIPAIRYLLVGGYFGVSDDLHIAWLFEMDRSLKGMQFPPRFVPDLSFGFGYPLFNFVYPLPFYIAEVFHLLGFSLVDSIKILMGLSLPVSSYFMYKFLRIFLNEELSFSGSLLYLYAPYRALEVFVRGSIGEIVAFVFFPLILYAIVKGKVALLGIASGFLILSHNILSYMFFPFAVLFLLIYRNNFKKNIIGLGLGLLLSIYFWLPAIVESNLMQYSTVFNFYDHYPTLKQLVTPFWGYGASVPGPYDTMSFYSGLVGVFVMLLGIIYFLFNSKKYERNIKLVIIWCAVVVFTSIFMMNHRSAFLWYNLPLLPYFQFPWRFLALLTFVYPLFLISLIKLKNTKVTFTISFLVVTFSILTTFNYFKYSEYLGRTDEYYLNRYVVVDRASEEYKKTGEEYLRLLKETKVRPNKVYDAAYVEEGMVADVLLETKELTPLKFEVKSSSEKDFKLNFSKYNFSGWEVKIDGNKVSAQTGEPYGQVTFDVPKGEHQIQIRYKETDIRNVLNIISFTTFLCLVVLLVRKNQK